MPRGPLAAAPARCSEQCTTDARPPSQHRTHSTHLAHARSACTYGVATANYNLIKPPPPASPRLRSPLASRPPESSLQRTRGRSTERRTGHAAALGSGEAWGRWVYFDRPIRAPNPGQFVGVAWSTVLARTTLRAGDARFRSRPRAAPHPAQCPHPTRGLPLPAEPILRTRTNTYTAHTPPLSRPHIFGRMGR
jgi:hypothetical protein